jgi:hypothetical protein
VFCDIFFFSFDLQSNFGIQDLSQNVRYENEIVGNITLGLLSLMVKKTKTRKFKAKPQFGKV